MDLRVCFAFDQLITSINFADRTLYVLHKNKYLSCACKELIAFLQEESNRPLEEGWKRGLLWTLIMMSM